MVSGALLVVLAGNCSGALAADFNLIPGVELNQAYQDNIFYTKDNTTGSFITTLAPSMTMNRATENWQTNIFAALKGIRYSGDHEFTGYSTVDQRFTGTSTYQVTPRVSWLVVGEYSKESNPNINLTQSVVSQNATKLYSQRYGLQGNYRFTERVTGTLSGDYYKFEYVTPQFPAGTAGNNGGGGLQPPPGSGGDSGGNGGGGGNNNPPPSLQSVPITLTNPDVTKYNPVFRLTANLDERTSGTLEANFAHFSYQYSSVDNYGVTLGGTRNLDEKWNISLSAGGRFTRSVYNEVIRYYIVYPTVVLKDEPLPQQTTKTWGWIGQAALTYNSLFSTSTLGFSRQIAPGRSSPIEQTNMYLNSTYRFTSEFDGSLGASYQLNYANQGEFANNATDDYYLNLSGGCNLKISRYATLSGMYLWQKFRTAGVPVTNNYVSVGLKFSYPMFENTNVPGVMDRL